MENDLVFYNSLKKYINNHTSVNDGELFTFSVDFKRDGDSFYFSNAKLLAAPQSVQSDGAVCPAHQTYFEEDGTCAILGCEETRPAANAVR